MSRTNETRHVEWYETFTCKYKLDARVCNNKQPWNEDKCRCECEELIDKGVCDKGFIWNSSNCECECDKSCNAGEYLVYYQLSDNLAMCPLSCTLPKKPFFTFQFGQEENISGNSIKRRVYWFILKIARLLRDSTDRVGKGWWTLL